MATDEQCLEAYYCRDHHETWVKASVAMGVGEKTLRVRAKEAEYRGLVGEFAGQVPNNMSINKVSKSYDKNGDEKGRTLHIGAQKANQDAPEGMAVKGISRLTDANGNTSAEWIKYDRNKPDLSSALETINAALKNVPKAPKLSKPKSVSSLLALYPLADLHLGLLAWGKETDEDWDISKAYDGYRDCMTRVAEGTENATEAVILGGGDLTHSDGLKPLTPAHGNILDVDSRWQKMLDTAIKLVAFQIELARQKHKKVIVRILPGNHDETTSLGVAFALKERYRETKQVVVDTDPSLFFWHRFGATMLGATHGHAAKLSDMPLIMANRKPEDWAAAKHRYVHGFHVHHKTQNIWEAGGVIGETHQSPSRQDAHHFAKGYLSGRTMQSITYDIEHGECARTTRVMLT